MHEESLKVKLENYQTDIEEYNHRKLMTIQKIEDYILQYQNLKKVYSHIIKDVKSIFIINSYS